MKYLIGLCAFALTGLFHARAELTVPAFTAYSAPNPNGLRISAPAGITGWTDARQQAEWFGHFKNPGKLTASITVRLPKGKDVTWKLDVAGQSREGRAEGAEGDVTVSFGEFAVAKAGYVRFSLSSAKPAGDVAALVLDGSALEGAHFNLEPRRNAASVHLAYQLPRGADMDAFYCEATAIEDPIWTFFMACGFQRGYFGMQVNSPTERRIIFSVWDSGAGTKAMGRGEVAPEDHTQLLSKGDGVEASAFGGEGTGGHSHLKYMWKTGEAQRFLLTSQPGKDGTAIYSGFWFHPEKKSWMRIASFQAPKASASLRGFHSFSENFIGANGELQRKARFCNQWVHLRGGDWQEITEASFSHDETGKSARLDRFMGVENGCFFLSNGGFIEGSTKYGERFKRPATGRPPADVDLGKLNAEP